MDSLTLTHYNNSLNGIVLYESIDRIALGKLIHSSLSYEDTTDWWLSHKYKTEKQQLTKYYELISNGQVKVRYTKNHDTIWGRCNPEKSLSLFSIRREIRHTISCQYYTDIDIANCHPIILYQICKKHNISCKTLEEYINNRENHLTIIQQMYGVSEDDAKTLFISLMYGGCFGSWSKKMKINIPASEFIQNFVNELKDISIIITRNNPNIYESVIQKQEKCQKPNFCVYRSTLSLFLQEIESRILESIYVYLNENGYIMNNNAVLCADGIMIETSKYNPELLNILPGIVKAKTGVSITLKTKDMNKGYSDKEINEKMTVDLHSPMFTTGMLSDYFCLLYDKFVYSDNRLYMFNGIYWEEDDKRVNTYNFIDSVFYKELVEYYFRKLESIRTIKDETEKKKQEDLLNKFHKNISTLRQIKYKKTLTEDICNKIYNRTIVFNDKPYIFAFNNAIYDLKMGRIIKPNKYDYISLTCGYNYETPDNSNKHKIEYEQLLSTIFPDPDVKEYYMYCLCTGLIGVQVENLFVATGEGGNGKGVINSQMLKTCGNYGYKLSSSVLLNEIKEGVNPQIANLSHKRFALTTEPTNKRKISTSTLKEITGDKTINSRMAYSNQCIVKLCITLMMECNRLPKLDDVGDSIVRRLRVIPFISSFKSPEEYERTINKTNIYIGNPKYKTDEFMEENRLTLFEILVPYCKKFIANNLIMPAPPDACKALTVDYLARSDHIYEWICERFHETEPDEFIYVKDIHSTYLHSDCYHNLTKEEKRNSTLKDFTEKLRTNIFLRNVFIERNGYINGQQLSKPAVRGFKIKNSSQS